jgi:hypothetical protein
MIHGDQTVMLGDRRSAAAYLRRMAAAVPQATVPLAAAAAHYEAVAAAETRVWRWGESMGPEVGQGLADRALRREIAAAVRAAGAEEARAVARLEEALRALG